MTVIHMDIVKYALSRSQLSRIALLAPELLANLVTMKFLNMENGRNLCRNRQPKS